MGSTVQSIFKALIKVSIVIFVSYLIMNLFLFAVSYFRILGISYTAQQIACENNYMPPDERAKIEQYLNDNVETALLQNVSFTEGTTFTKQQYGNVAVVGIQADFQFMLPLLHNEMINGEIEGYGNNSNQFEGWKTNAELEEAREPNNCNIKIEYRVPGLKYYPDLED